MPGHGAFLSSLVPKAEEDKIRARWGSVARPGPAAEGDSSSQPAARAADAESVIRLFSVLLTLM